MSHAPIISDFSVSSSEECKQLMTRVESILNDELMRCVNNNCQNEGLGYSVFSVGPVISAYFFIVITY